MLKAIENAARRLLLRGLVAVLGGRRDTPLPDWRARPHRVLFIRDDGIGDFIVSIEVMRAIAESSPTITFDIVASPQNAPIARTLPFVNEVIVHRREFLLKALPTWRRLRRNRYDAVVDGRVAVRNVNMQTSCLFGARAAPWRIGLAGPRKRSVYTVKIPEENLPHWTDQVVALAAPFGIAPDSRDWRPAFPCQRPPRRRRGTVEPGRTRAARALELSVGHPERWWPPERYGPVLRRVRERVPNAAIMLVGMPNELATAEETREADRWQAWFRCPARGHCRGRDRRPALSTDTSVTHAASAFETTTLCLQRKDTGQWSPYKTHGRVVSATIRSASPPLPPERVVAATRQSDR